MKKFQVPQSYYPAENKTIRFPVDLIDKIENAIVCKNCSFSAFIVAAVRFALENMNENENEN